MITIIDYGMGNLRSAQKACEYVGLTTQISGDKKDIENADALILPGVGAFGDAMTNLNNMGLTQTIINRAKSGLPFLGICIGMQLLFDKSYEYGETAGLGLIGGEVTEFQLDGLKIPHMGWNNLEAKQSPLFDAGNNQFVYFVHSYYANKVAEEDIIASSTYGITFPSAVQHSNIFGLQFHPEKSGDVGLNILRNFGKLI